MVFVVYDPFQAFVVYDPLLKILATPLVCCMARCHEVDRNVKRVIRYSSKLLLLLSCKLLAGTKRRLALGNFLRNSFVCFRMYLLSYLRMNKMS